MASGLLALLPLAAEKEGLLKEAANLLNLADVYICRAALVSWAEEGYRLSENIRNLLNQPLMPDVD